MNRPIRAVVLLDASVDRHVVETLVTSSPQLNVLDYLALDAVAASDSTADIVLIACADYSPEVADCLAEASRLRSTRPVVLMTGGLNGYVGDAFSHGADDIIALPDHDDTTAMTGATSEIVFMLEKAIARKRGAATGGASPLGGMICVLGLKGGSGKTLTVANLAVALALAGERVAVVDLDLQFGDIGLALGLSPDRTIYDLVRSGGSLDAEKLADFMPKHHSGVRALLAPTRPDHASVVTIEFLRDVYQLLRESNDFVIVDTPPSFAPEVIAAVDASTDVCMVAMLDSLSLKNTKLGLETLELMDYQSDRIKLVLNRADSKVGISLDDVAAIMGRRPSILIPSDRTLTRSINEGEPIAAANRRNDATRAFHALASVYLRDRQAKLPQPKRPPRRHVFGRN